MKVSYYPGCSLEGTAREYAESIAAVSRVLGIELQELPDWTCCGSSSAHVTDDMLAVALSARNLEIADRAGMNLVVPCAACYQRLKVAEKQLLTGQTIDGVTHKYEGKFYIRHIADFFWEDVGEKAITEQVRKPLVGLNLVCYYGCLTARPPKVTDAKNPENPQAMDNLLKSLGANVRNWSYKTDCCGGSLILSRPDIARELIKRLFDMAEEAGADCIVTGCPMCQSNLDTWQEEISREAGREYNMPVFYFTELMGLAFRDSSVAKWLHRHTTDTIPLLKQRGLS